MSLASDVSPSSSTEVQASGSVTGARTGIRIHPPAGSSVVRKAEALATIAYPPSTDGSAVGYSDWLPRAAALAMVRKPTKRCHWMPAGYPARERDISHLHHSRPLLSAEACHIGSLRRCGTDPATSSRFDFSRSFRWLARQVRKQFAPFRWIEIELRRPIRQGGKTQLFHFIPVPLWTGVDKSSFRRKC
jgi:hypothetical protein